MPKFTKNENNAWPNRTRTSLQLVFQLLIELLEHVSKSEPYFYAVIFDSNNKNFENGGGQIP